MENSSVLIILIGLAIVIALILVLKYYKVELPEMPNFKDIPGMDNLKNIMEDGEETPEVD